MWVANAIVLAFFGIETVINKLEFQRVKLSRHMVFILCDGMGVDTLGEVRHSSKTLQ